MASLAAAPYPAGHLKKRPWDTPIRNAGIETP
jgi:hypothetical protein